MRRALAFCLTLVAPLLCAASLSAQTDIDPSAMSDAELMQALAALEAPAPSGRVSIAGIPGGFGLPAGVGHVGLGVTDRRDRRRRGDWDGSIALALGFGDADRALGVTALVEITSVSAFHFGQSGKAGLSFHRNVPLGSEWRGAVALEARNLVRWGDSAVLEPEWGLAASAVRSGTTPVMLSLGYGSAVSDFGLEPGWTAGIGLGLSDRMGVSLAWNGDEVIGGLNLWLDQPQGLSASLQFGDMLNQQDGRRLVLSVGLTRRLWN